MTGKCEDVENKFLRSKYREKIETFDDILPHIGDFGKYQWILLLKLVPFGFFFIFVYFSQIFITAVPQNHWCKVNELMNINLTREQRIQISIPKTKQYPYYDKCHYKNLNYGNINVISNDNFNSSKWETHEIIKCSQWEYDHNDIPYATVGSELNWVCDHEYLIATSQALFYAGSAFGNFIFGWISDQKGRIKGLLCSTAVAFISSIATANTFSFWSFATCRFFAGFAYDSFMTIPLIIAMEYVGIHKRTTISCYALAVSYLFGSLTMAWSAYYINNWRYFTIFCALSYLLCFLITFFVPESTRWYLSKGKTDKILKKLRKIAQVNGKHPEPWIYNELVKSITEGKKGIENVILLDLRKTPHLARHTIILAMVYAINSLILDTYIYFSNRFNLSIFLSFTFFGFEIVIAAILVKLTSDQWGRRICGSLGMILTTIFSFTFIFNESETLKTVVGCTGRLCIIFVQLIYVQYVPEFFPTSIRTQGTALIHFLSLVIHFIAPYIVILASTWRELPLLIIGILALFDSILILFLPETANRTLPQTIQDGENFCKNKKFLPLIVTKKGENY